MKCSVQRFLVFPLMLSLICMSLSAQKTSKTVKQKKLTYEELEFMHKIDYDFRHPCWRTTGYYPEQSLELANAQFEDIFYHTFDEAYRRKTIDRLSEGLRDTSNLIDLVSCYQKMLKHSNYSDNATYYYSEEEVVSFLYVYLPSLEFQELDYLLKLSNDKLRELARTYARYLKKNNFPPR